MRGEDDMPQNPHKGNIYCNVRHLLVVVKEEENSLSSSWL
jgi:hypothetical protein